MELTICTKGGPFRKKLVYTPTSKKNINLHH